MALRGLQAEGDDAMKLLKRRGWRKQIGFDKQCPIYERVVFGMELRIWRANWFYWGAIDNGASSKAEDPAVLAKRLEKKAGQRLCKMGTKLISGARR